MTTPKVSDRFLNRDGSLMTMEEAFKKYSDFQSAKKSWLGILEQEGATEVGECFVQAHLHADEDVISPEEFFIYIKDNKEKQRLQEQFRSEQRRFLLQFYEKNFGSFSDECIASTFAANDDISEEVRDRMSEMLKLSGY